MKKILCFIISHKLILGIISFLVIGSVIAGMIIINTNNDKNYCTVSFDTAGGSYVEDMVVKKGEKINVPEISIKEGFSFEGWYYGDILYDFNQPINENIILTAKWKNDGSLKTILIYFDTDGGTKINNIEIVKGNKITEPISPSKKGYSFGGWYFNDELFDFDIVINDNTTLVAKWIKGEGNDVKTSRGESKQESNNTVVNNINDIDEMNESEISNIINNLKGMWYYEKDLDNFVYIDGHDSYILGKKAFELTWSNIDIYKLVVFPKEGHPASLYLYYPITSASLKQFMNSLHITSVTSSKLVIGNKYTFNRTKKTIDYSQFDKYLGTWYKISGSGMSEIKISKEQDSYGNIFFRVGNYPAEAISNKAIAEHNTVFDKYTTWSGNNLKIGDELYSKNKNDVPVALYSFSVELPNRDNLKIGDKIQAYIKPSPSNATNLTGTWRITNSKVATIDQNGLITVIGFGDTLVEFTSNDGNITKTNGFHVYEKMPESIVFDVSELSLLVGESKTIHYSFNPPDVYSNEVYSIVSASGVIDSNDNNGTVTITGLKPGEITYTIEHKNSRKKGSITIKVLPIKATGITMDCSNLDMYREDTKTLQVLFTPSNTTDKSLSWSSSNQSVISIDSKGKMTANKKGTSVITAVSNDGGFSASCSVNVNYHPLNATASISKNIISIPNYYSATVNVSVKPTGGSGVYTYNIKLFKNDVLYSKTGASSNLVAIYETGSYRAEYTVRDLETNEEYNGSSGPTTFGE